MFCPLCGSRTEARGDTAWCRKGDMPLSVQMDRDLRAAFAPDSEITVPPPLRITVGGSWWCPLDGRRMVERDDSIGCPDCGRSLNPYWYALMEFHPHRRA